MKHNKVLFRTFLIISMAIILIFSTSLLADGSDSAQLPFKPWNGYWWPTREGGLITGEAHYFWGTPPQYYSGWEGFFSPFDKYCVVEGKNPRGDVWDWEYTNHYDPNALNWYGHCNGWASASATEVEPTEPGEVGRVYFRIGDKKGLLTEMHQNDGAIMYGERYNGDDGDDPDDIYPDLFHETLVHYIKDLKKPILLETDPGIEIWNYPCYKYDMSWVDDGNTKHFTTTVYLARDNVGPDDISEAYSTITYTYDLFYDDSGYITGGKWTGSSINNHPDFMWEDISRNQGNPYLEYDKVKNIVQSTVNDSLEDDDLEPNNSAITAKTLPWDIWFGRLLDDDWFEILAEAGEKIKVDVYPEKIDGTVSCSLLTPSGQILPTENSERHRLEMDAGLVDHDTSLILHIHPDKVQSNHRNYGLAVVRSGNSYYMPHLVNADGWSTVMTLLNPTDSDNDIYFNFYHTDEEGVFKQYYPASLEKMGPGQFKSGNIDSFFSGIDSDNQRWLKVRTGNNLEGMFLFTNTEHGQNLASMPLFSNGLFTLYLNHIAVDDTWWTGISIANVDAFRAVHLKLTPFTAGGEELDEVFNVTVPGGGRYINMLRNVFSPAILGQAGWIRIDSDEKVVGFELFGTNDLSLFEGVPLQAGGQVEQIAARVMTENGWWTGISIVNVSQSSARVTITPYNENGLNAYGVFNPEEFSITLEPGEKYVVLVDQLFPDPSEGPISALRIESNRPVAGFVLYGNFSDGKLLGYTFQNDNDGDTSGIVPYFTGLNLIASNMLGTHSSNITLKAYDENGNLIGESGLIDIPLRATKLLSLKDTFGDVVLQNTAYITWQSKNALVVMGEIQQPEMGTAFISLKK